MRAIRVLLTLMLTTLLSGCPTTSVRGPQSSPPLPPAPAADVRGVRLYTVDPDASEVRIHVYRGGSLARLGHNHVMTSRHLVGRIWTHKILERCGFELEFPVAELIVDDPQARAEAGREFPGEIPPSDRAATHKNMLGPAVLDVLRYPKIALRSVHIGGSTLQPDITARISIKGVERDLRIPATVSIADRRLTATGEFDILQSDFGIKPFSVALGALTVQDRLHIVFKIVAREGV